MVYIKNALFFSSKFHKGNSLNLQKEFKLGLYVSFSISTFHSKHKVTENTVISIKPLVIWIESLECEGGGKFPDVRKSPASLVF